MASYELSPAADEDFENIFDYGINTFGLEQAVIYQTVTIHSNPSIKSAESVYSGH